MLHKQGKFDFLDANGLDKLVQIVLHDETKHVQIHALKTLCCIAEAPQGRKKLQPLLEHLQSKHETIKSMEHCDAQLLESMQEAIDCIAWKP